MGRSVNYDSNAEVVVYFPFDGEESWEWEDLLDNLRYVIRNKYQSFDEADGWKGNELNRLLENNHAEVFVSEYGGLVSVSLSPKDVDSGYDDDVKYQNIANAWTSRVATNFKKLLDENFGGLNKVAVASNGEAFYERV